MDSGVQPAPCRENKDRASGAHFRSGKGRGAQRRSRNKPVFYKEAPRPAWDSASALSEKTFPFRKSNQRVYILHIPQFLRAFRRLYERKFGGRNPVPLLQPGEDALYSFSEGIFQSREADILNNIRGVISKAQEVFSFQFSVFRIVTTLSKVCAV